MSIDKLPDSIKIIYISFIKLTDKIARDWFINYSINKGAIVEFWDIIPLIREEYIEPRQQYETYLRYIKTHQEFEILLKQPENISAIFVMLISYDGGRLSFPFRILSKYCCRMVFISWGAMPVSPLKPNWKIRFNRFFSNPTFFAMRVLDKLTGSAYRKLKLVNRFNIVFTAGSILTNTNQYTDRVIPINLCDYDQYLIAQKSNVRLIRNKYAVFLDTNLPYQSDIGFTGRQSLNSRDYFKSLDIFFTHLESIHNIEVVIAAHPKAFYEVNTYDGRQIHRLVTAELVKDAEFVISHTSTSLCHAVLNYKSIVFIYTEEMLKLYENTMIEEIKNAAKYFQVNAININRLNNHTNVLIEQPNKIIYDDYKYKYLTSQCSEDKLSAEIFWSEIINLSHSARMNN